MKQVWMAALLLTACGGATDTVDADADREYWLVRHAEKETGDDPALTAAGQARAEALAERLSNAGLTHIHSTDTRRTRDTAAPTAAQMRLEVEIYDARDLDGFAGALLGMDGAHLVVGHSNTTPGLADALGCGPQDEIVEATEYDRLYHIRVAGEGVDCRVERYGG